MYKSSPIQKKEWNERKIVWNRLPVIWGKNWQVKLDSECEIKIL